MKVAEYYTIVEKTAVYPQQVNNFGLAYAVLGLFDEMNELGAVNTKDEQIKESGDVLWYVAAICKELDISFEEIIHTFMSANDDIIPFKIFGVVKKYYRDNKKVDLEIVIDTLKLIVRGVLEDATDNGITLEMILQTNYDKLIERHATNTISGDGETVEQRLANESK